MFFYLSFAKLNRARMCKPFKAPRNRFKAWRTVPVRQPYLTYRPTRAGIFEQSMGARNRGGIRLSYRPARLHRLAEFIPWNRFLGSINVNKFGLWFPSVCPAGPEWSCKTWKSEVFTCDRPPPRQRRTAAVAARTGSVGRVQLSHAFSMKRTSDIILLNVKCDHQGFDCLAIYVYQ